MEIIKIRATKYQITIADLLELIIIHGETFNHSIEIDSSIERLLCTTFQ